MTFVPCFLWIFLGAPVHGNDAQQQALSAALAAITAAVVGVILNLAVWFALHVLFRELYEGAGFGMTVDVPVSSSVNLDSLILTVAAMVAVFRFKIGMLTVLAGCSLIGLVYGLFMEWIQAPVTRTTTCCSCWQFRNGKATLRNTEPTASLEDVAIIARTQAPASGNPAAAGPFSFCRKEKTDEHQGYQCDP